MIRTGIVVLLLVTSSAAIGQDQTFSAALVRQDFSDCGNSNVAAADASRVGGSVAVTRHSDASGTVSVSLARGTPNTSYHFFLKCVRILGDVRTDARGAGSGSFALRAGEFGNSPTFDMYPEGAPSGDKFQSVRASFTTAPAGGDQPRAGGMSVQGVCRAPTPYPAANNPAACCGQPGLDYCGGSECCDRGYCQAGHCCTCQTCNDKTACCPGVYPDTQTCSVNTRNQQVCSTQANLCIDTKQVNGLCGDEIRISTGKLPLSCDNTTQFCDLPGFGSPTCSFIPACIWDYPECALPGPMAITPVSPDTTIFACRVNFDASKCMHVTGTDCTGATQDFPTGKIGFCRQAITYAHSPMSTETMQFPSSCVPDGWVVAPKNCPQVAMGTRPSPGGGRPVPQVLMGVNYIYRVLRADEIRSDDISAKDPTATYTVGGHVTQGNVLSTQYISAATDPMASVAYCKGLKNAGRKMIVEMSVSKLIEAGCQVIDVAKGEYINPRNVRALRFAASQNEVLIVGSLIAGSDDKFTACSQARKAVTWAIDNCGDTPK